MSRGVTLLAPETILLSKDTKVPILVLDVSGDAPGVAEACLDDIVVSDPDADPMIVTPHL